MLKLKVFFVMGMIITVLVMCAFAPGVCIERFVLPDGCCMDCIGSENSCCTSCASEGCINTSCR